MLRNMVLAAALAIVAAPALADTPVLDQRQERQMERIQQGWQSGELTRREAAGLARGQQQVRRMEHRAKADGTVTSRERARLQQQANVQSRHIHRQKHDGQSRGGG